MLITNPIRHPENTIMINDRPLIIQKGDIISFMVKDDYAGLNELMQIKTIKNQKVAIINFRKPLLNLKKYRTKTKIKDIINFSNPKTIKILQLLKLNNIKDKKIRQVNPVEKINITIARNLLLLPKILLFYRPLSGFKSPRQFYQLLFDLKVYSSCTIILVDSFPGIHSIADKTFIAQKAKRGVLPCFELLE